MGSRKRTRPKGPRLSQSEAAVRSADTHWRWRSAACSLLIIGAGIAAYSTSFDGVFLLDEDRRIVNDERIRDPWPPWRLLSRRRPVVDASLAINYAIGELDVRGYHAFNLAVHLLAGLTLFGVVRWTLLSHRLRERYGPASHWLALGVALLWVVHPLQTQSVTYIIQRAEALMGLFYLLTVYCVVRGTDSPRPQLWYAAAVAACGIGMGSKAVMVTAPVMVLLYDRTFLAGTFAGALRRRWGLYAGLVATWGVLVACGVAQGVLSTAPKQTAHVGFAFKGISPLEYLLTEQGVVAYYLRLALWPHPLCLDYYWPVARTAGEIFGPMLLLAPLLIGTVWALVKKPWLGFIGMWFFLILAPTSSIIPIKDPAFEHRMYLPLAAVVALVVFGAQSLLNRLVGHNSSGGAPRVAAVLLLAATGILAYMTARRNTDYHDDFTMWRDIVRLRPNNPRAHNNLALRWEAKGNLDEAVRELNEAIRVQPNFVNAHANLGTILFRQGKFDEGIAKYRFALSIDPNYAFGRTKLGDALAQRGMIDEGIKELRTVLAAKPNDPHAHYALGNALTRAGDIEEAIAEYRAALRVTPSVAEIHYALANALRDASRPEDAIEEYKTALRIKPDLVSAHNNVGHVFYNLGRFDEAIDSYRSALRLVPGKLSSRYGLASALAGEGMFDEAVAEYHAVLRARPGFADTRYRLALALTEIGKLDEAIVQLREALRANPGRPEVRRALESVLAEYRRRQEMSGG